MKELKLYEKSEIEIVKLNSQDVILASNTGIDADNDPANANATTAIQGVYDYFN